MIKICSYCGYTQEYEEDEFCECGGEFVLSSDDYNAEIYSWERDKINANCHDDFYYGDMNNIDNILEYKRSKVKWRG